jgi:hypothetical protein
VSERYELIDAEKATLTETGEKSTRSPRCANGWTCRSSGYDEWVDRPDLATTQREIAIKRAVRKLRGPAPQNHHQVSG